MTNPSTPATGAMGGATMPASPMPAGGGAPGAMPNINVVQPQTFTQSWGGMGMGPRSTRQMMSRFRMPGGPMMPRYSARPTNMRADVNGVQQAMAKMGRQKMAALPTFAQPGNVPNPLSLSLGVPPTPSQAATLNAPPPPPAMAGAMPPAGPSLPPQAAGGASTAPPPPPPSASAAAVPPAAAAGGLPSQPPPPGAMPPPSGGVPGAPGDVSGLAEPTNVVSDIVNDGVVAGTADPAAGAEAAQSEVGLPTDKVANFLMSLLPGSPVAPVIRPTPEREVALARSFGSPRATAVEGADLGGTAAGAAIGGGYGAIQGGRLASRLLGSWGKIPKSVRPKGIMALPVSKGRLLGLGTGVGVGGALGSVLLGELGGRLGRDTANDSLGPSPELSAFSKGAAAELGRLDVSDYARSFLIRCAESGRDVLEAAGAAERAFGKEAAEELWPAIAQLSNKSAEWYDPRGPLFKKIAPYKSEAHVTLDKHHPSAGVSDAFARTEEKPVTGDQLRLLASRNVKTADLKQTAMQYFQKGLNGAGSAARSFLGPGAQKVQRAVNVANAGAANAANMGLHGVPSIRPAPTFFQGMRQGVPGSVMRPNPGLGWNVADRALGAVTGYQAGQNLVPGGEDSPLAGWTGAVYGGLSGFSGTRMGRGNFARSAYQPWRQAMMGTAGGYLGDSALGAFGVNTGDALSRWGSRLGLGSGLVGNAASARNLWGQAARQGLERNPAFVGQSADLLSRQFQNPGWANAARNVGRGLNAFESGGMTPVNAIGRGLGRAGKWITGNGDWRRGLARAGGVAAAVPIASMIHGAVSGSLGDYLHGHVAQGVQEGVEGGLGTLDNYLSERGVVDPETGHFQLPEGAMNPLSRISNYFRGLSPAQRMMALGGGTVGLGGLAMGSPLLAAGGLGTAAFGATPQAGDLMNYLVQAARASHPGAFRPRDELAAQAAYQQPTPTGQGWH